MKNKFNDLMLDLETMGNESFSAIVSIGALEFNLETGETGKEFYVNVDLQSCLDLGLTVNASTIMWWMNQSDQARHDLTSKKALPILDALSEFSIFINNNDYRVWGNSASFDCGILANAYKKANIEVPWMHWNERCVRTLASFKPEIKKAFKFKGTAHNALDDCYHQVGYCYEIWKSLNNL